MSKHACAFVTTGLIAGLAAGCGSDGSSGAPVGATAAATSATGGGGGSSTGSTSSSANPSPTPSPVAPPVVTAASVASGWNDRDTALDLDGTGFLPTSTVRLESTSGAHALTQVVVRSEFRIEAVVPPGAAPGAYEVVVEHQGGVSSGGPTFAVDNLLDVDLPGAFASGYRDARMPGASGDTVDVRIYYPAVQAGQGAAPAPGAGPYPLVVYGHGFKPPLFAAGIDYRANTFLADTLAAFGYIVVCPDLATNNDLFGSGSSGQANSGRDADDLLAAIDYLATVSNDPNDPLSGLVDTTRVGLAGHSRGGDAALMAGAAEVAAAGAANSRVKALAAFGPPSTDSRNNNAPLNFGDFTDLPTFLVGASNDQIAPPAQQRDILALAGSPSWMVEITGGNHSQYKDSGSTILSDGSAAIPLAEQQAICQRYATAWFHRHVKGVQAPVVADTIMRGARVTADARLGAVDVR